MNFLLKILKYKKLAELVSILSLLSGCCDLTEPTPITTPYNKNGFSMTLPADWAVHQDYYPEAYRRLITILTSVGSTATINIFDIQATRPNLEMFLQQYMADAIPVEDRDSVNISYGEVTRQQGRGYFVEVQLKDESDTAFYVEIVEMMYVNHLSYVTLHTPMATKGEVLSQFNTLIDSING